MRQPRPYCLMMRSRIYPHPPKGWSENIAVSPHLPHQRAVAAVPVERRLGRRGTAPGIDRAAQHEARHVLHLAGRFTFDRMPMQVLELFAWRKLAGGLRAVGDEEAGMEADRRIGR